MHNFRELRVWQKAVELAANIYQLTSQFPKEEKYGLTSQIQRSAVSVASNIAEGAGRSSPKEFSHFLSIAAGSSYELETQLVIANRLQIANAIHIEPLIRGVVEVQKMIFMLKKSLQT